MDRNSKTSFTPKKSTDYKSISRPIVGIKDEYPAGYLDPMHHHKRSQLLYASSGVMSVITETNIFAVPPQRALWIPSGIYHEVSCRSSVSLRTLYIDSDYTDQEVEHCLLIKVSDFLKALITEILSSGVNSTMTERQSLIYRLILKEIWAMPKAPYHARMPKDRRLRLACQIITANPAHQANLDELSGLASMSRRSFTRLFKKETGMGFAVWRQQLRLIEALSLMDMGRSITATAYDVGYNSPSAFTAAFHRTIGVTPSKYFLR